MKNFRRAFLYSSLLCLAWATSIAVGLRIFGHGSATYDRRATAPTNFPADAALAMATDQPTLILLAQSPSSETRNALAELSRSMTELQGKVKAYVVISRPENAGANWMATQLWSDAAKIPGITLVGDEDGRETRRFGGETSGQTLLYSPSGQLLYAGTGPIAAARLTAAN